ncbi:MAG: hypothetical protein VCA55_13635 [Verrucomicrobiales bacterium]
MKLQHHRIYALVALISAVTPKEANAETIVLDFELTPPAGKLSVTDIPRNPRSFVIDEPARFSPGKKSELEQSLAKMQSALTYVVIKKGKLPVPADLYGNELLRRWTPGGVRFSALVLCVNTPLPEILVILAGRNLKQNTENNLLKLGNAALHLANGQTDQLEGVKTTAVALASALDTFAELYRQPGSQPNLTVPARNLSPPFSPATSQDQAEGQLYSRSNGQKTTSQWDLLAARIDWNLIITISIIIGGFISLVIALVLVRRICRHRPLYFPIPQSRHRFSAPYSGGSNAQIKYGR